MIAVCRTALLVFCLGAYPVTVGAQSDPLFMSDAPLSISVELPMSPLVRGAARNPVSDGMMYFVDTDGSAVNIEISMTTRGKSRLDYCRFPPLKIDLKQAQAKGTMFQGQNKIKLVTHCRNGHLHHRYLQQEFGIYKAYNVLTESSYRVRWITVTYKDSTGKRDDEIHNAFFIESNRELAQRLGSQSVVQNGVSSMRLDPAATSRYALFQFLIANTDWSMLRGPVGEGCCHNGRVLVTSGSTDHWVIVPYDFDQSGLMNTRYARPADALRIRSVRQRSYRGRCRHNDQLDLTIAQFNAKRAEMMVHLAPAVLSARLRKNATKYIDTFYKIVNDPKKRQRQLTESCVGV